ncbi:magnesium transporter [Aquisalimonas sp. APHAB1-3]|uniref:magnesium transporter n=1 Tax=Aquisalimonas sp. APHAB1-3 TaxID=3402080 RepID=UPI003AAD1239
MANEIVLNEVTQSGNLESRVNEPVDGVMTDSFVRVPTGATAGETLRKVKTYPLDDGAASVVFVDGSGGRYAGFVRLGALVRADEETTVDQLLEGRDIRVSSETDREQAARLLQRHDLALLPVVNESQRLVGALRFDDAMDILEEEASEDAYWKAGVGDVLHHQDAVRSEKLTLGPIGYTLKVRMAFLLVTLAGGMMVGGVIDHFEGALEALVALAIFIPVIMDMGGNVGTQSTTIFARGLALGHIDLKKFFRVHMVRELKVAVCMGLVLATLGGIIAWAWQGAPNDIPMLGVVVGISLMFAITTACLLGFLLPWLLLKLGVDHAPGADPFITTIKDFSGLAVYFMTAAWLLPVTL